MVHEGCFRNTVEENSPGTDFAAAARAHLKALADAGETPEQIIRQLADVVASYVSGGLEDEAKTLREIIRKYQMRWTTDGARPS
jgi:hypothetical protein